jgi:hypothetical protein
MGKTEKTIQQLITDKHTKYLRLGFHLSSEMQYGKMPALGDYRWTTDLILSTRVQAETGRPPSNGLEYRVGNSGGGFDILDFKYLSEDQWLAEDEPVDTSIPLNRRHYDPKTLYH